MRLNGCKMGLKLRYNEPGSNIWIKQAKYGICENDRFIFLKWPRAMEMSSEELLSLCNTVIEYNNSRKNPYMVKDLNYVFDLADHRPKLLLSLSSAGVPIQNILVSSDDVSIKTSYEVEKTNHGASIADYIRGIGSYDNTRIPVSLSYANADGTKKTVYNDSKYAITSYQNNDFDERVAEFVFFHVSNNYKRGTFELVRTQYDGNARGDRQILIPSNPKFLTDKTGFFDSSLWQEELLCKREEQVDLNSDDVYDRKVKRLTDSIDLVHGTLAYNYSKGIMYSCGSKATNRCRELVKRKR